VRRSPPESAETAAQSVRSRMARFGQAPTWHISLATALVRRRSWWLGRVGWIKPLFLPPPRRPSTRSSRDYGDTPNGALAQHVEISVLRVLAAFGLAVVTAVPVGIAMGPRACARHCRPVDRVYRPLPPLGICRSL